MKQTPDKGLKRGRERGSTMVETVISMLLICFILFTLIQLAFLLVARESASYASFRVSRSRAVGFRAREAYVEGLVRSIPGAGARVYPSPGYSTVYSNVTSEKQAIEDFLTGDNMLCYEFWGNGNDGSEPIDTGISNPETRTVVSFPKNPVQHGSERYVYGRVYYVEYPLIKFMFSDAISGGDPYYRLGEKNKYFLPAYYQDYLKAF